MGAPTPITRVSLGIAAYKPKCMRIFNGAQGRNRTTDTRIFSPLLYRLSYLGAGPQTVGPVL